MYESNSRKMIRQRALLMAIETGEMPNIDLIWKDQQADRHTPCFGQGHDCHQRDCKWRRQCMTLTNYQTQTMDQPQQLTA